LVVWLPFPPLFPPTIELYIFNGTQIRLPKSPSPFHELSCRRNSHRPVHHLRGSIRIRTFHPGKFSYPIAIAAVLWIAFISIVFFLPKLNSINSQSLSYTPVISGLSLHTPLIWDYKRPWIVRGTHQADRRCATRSLLHVCRL
jgi:hypothetical protein